MTRSSAVAMLVPMKTGTQPPSRIELLAPTPAAWYDAALAQLDELLVDHANCEKKAASSALALMFTYGEDAALTERLSRLAREELRHFEQVQRMMRELGIAPRRMAPSRYAEGLRKAVRRHEPGRLLDLLLAGAYIEARSCERFDGLVPRLAAPLNRFYAGLATSEARHQGMYLRLAAERTAPERAEDFAASRARLGAVEAELATAPDPGALRFHSGPPRAR
jgi:tRNA 2-(methylsulfanyl)-N6-isopentenyladenosine37 hydroxylase